MAIKIRQTRSKTIGKKRDKNLEKTAAFRIRASSRRAEVISADGTPDLPRI